MIGSWWANVQEFSPADIAGLALWLDATDPANTGVQPANNSAISTWVDKSPSAHDVSQGTGANQPTYKTAILNNKPVVRFNGTTTYLQNTVITSLGTACSIFIAGTINDNGSAQGTFLEYSLGAASNTGNLMFYETGDIKFRVVSATIHKTTVYADALPISTVINGYSDTSNVFLLTDGIQRDTVAGGNMDATNRITVGSLAALIGIYYLNGDIGEIVVYNSSISAPNRAKVTNYLRNKWGI